MKALFFRCQYGHYFRGVSCPYDCWTHSDIPEVLSMVEANEDVCISDLMSLEIDESLKRDTMILECVELPCSVEAIKLASFVAENTAVKIDDWGNKEE